MAADRAKGVAPGLVLAAMTACLAMVFVDQTVVSVALPTIRDELGLSTAEFNWVVNGYLLAVAALAITLGRLSDQIGHARGVTIAIAKHHFTHELIEASNSFCLHLIDEQHIDWVWRFGIPSGRQFDKLVSIEMIEADGHKYYATFFDVCRRMLSRKGLMLIQAITMDERLYERAKRSVDFIQHAVFPGSCIPSISTLIRASSDAGRMTLVDLEDIGAHYAPTLRAWRRNVVRARQDIAKLGYQLDFLRLWEFYLCYCEGGFLERSISTVQLMFSQPGWRPAPVGC